MNNYFKFRIVFLLFFLGLSLPLSNKLWGQFTTYYSTRSIDFFEKEEELEGFQSFKLIPHTDVFISFNSGFGFVSEENNFNLINNKLQNILKDLNQAESDSDEHYVNFNENRIIPYQLGISLDFFLFKYYGLGFTYTGNNYYTHKVTISKKKSTTDKYYDKTKSYEIINQGNNYKFTLMGRYPFGKRKDYNIFFVGGIGYNYSTSKVKLKYYDKVDNQNTSQEFTDSSHGYHLRSGFVFKINFFHINVGLLLNGITFNNYTPSDNTTLVKYDSITLGPMIYLKTGLNF